MREAKIQLNFERWAKINGYNILRSSLDKYFNYCDIIIEKEKKIVVECKTSLMNGNRNLRNVVYAAIGQLLLSKNFQKADEMWMVGDFHFQLSKKEFWRDKHLYQFVKSLKIRIFIPRKNSFVEVSK